MDDSWREVVAEWGGEMGFIGRNPAGGCVQMGTLNGQPGIGPMEMLLLGVAGCTGMDVVSILKKMRQDLQAFQVQVRGNRRSDYPQIFTEIEVIYHLWGEELDPKSVKSAIELSELKYCSASAMLSAAAQMRSSFHIYRPGEPIEK